MRARTGGSDPLCCCEYVNVEGERSHILAVCCDCNVIDDTCDRWIKGLNIPASRFGAIWTVIMDRLRIPWVGGARKFDLEIWAAPILIAMVFSVSTVSIGLSFLIIVVILLASRRIVHHQTKFYYMWTVSSFVGLITAFEYLIVPLMVISWYEHTLFVLLLTLALFCWLRVRVHRGWCESEGLEGGVSADQDVCDQCEEVQPARAYHCTVCGRCVLLRDHHCVWLDCCVGGGNQRAFVVGLASVSAALLWATYLTLTTVCYCRTLAGTWQLPVSCDTGPQGHPVAVFGACYAVVSATLCCCLLCQQCCLISRGLTGCEHRRRLPPPAASRGVIDNWRRFISGRRPHERPVGQAG